VLVGATDTTVSSSDGVKLSLIEAGDSTRPTLVFIHGYPDTKELWQLLMERLTDRYHVVAYDVRGAGASSAPRGPAGYDFELLADDLEAVIETVSPGRRVHLVGHDWGAIQGWEFVTLDRFRDSLASFTAIACPPLDQVAATGRRLLSRPTPGSLTKLVSRLRRSWYVAALWTPGVPTVAWRMALAGGRWQWILREIEHVPEASVSPTLADDGIHGSNLYRRNVPRRLLRPRRNAVAHVPVQLVIPTQDHFVPVGYYEGVEDRAPNLTKRTIGTTHWAPRIRPDLLARWVSEQVDQVEDNTRPTNRGQWVPGGGIEQLVGRLALVTGAASGIGRAIAEALADRGARLLLVDRDAEALERAGSSMAGSQTFACDVSDQQAMERLANRVLGEHGVPDVVVNNAGIGVAGTFMDTAFEDWGRIVGVNLMGVVHGCRLFGRAMIERGQGGQIVNTASAAAFLPSKALPAYATTKAGVLMLSECLRAELQPYGIGVTAICPGFIATNITRATRYVGRSEAEGQRVGERLTRLYRRRNFGPERVAAEVLEAIARDRPVAAITPEAKAMRAISRFAPRLMRRLARLDALPA
jgi:NAD(P)-dependent dehydrogenase (short-subunit alcohol dehydrogenase family)/pimeloyl-ACP methyl ester carboxylesterase